MGTSQIGPATIFKTQALVLVLLSMYINTSMAAGQCRQDAILETLQVNKQLQNHTFLSLEIVPTVGICQEACDFVETCQSANFLESKKICELNDATHLSFKVKDSFQDNPHSVYFFKDIDECATNTSICPSLNLTCENLPGTYKCVCPPERPRMWRSIFDFESGRLDGWVLVGEAFNNQPTYGDNMSARGRKNSSHVGDWWIGTAEDRHSPNDPAGRSRGDKPMGETTSPSFIIRGNALRYRIGGGDSINKVFAELMIDGKPVKRDGAIFSESMRQKEWLVGDAFFGKEAKLRLVDNSSSIWGFITFDHLEGYFC